MTLTLCKDCDGALSDHDVEHPGQCCNCYDWRWYGDKEDMVQKLETEDPAWAQRRRDKGKDRIRQK